LIRPEIVFDCDVFLLVRLTFVTVRTLNQLTFVILEDFYVYNLIQNLFNLRKIYFYHHFTRNYFYFGDVYLIFDKYTFTDKQN
jgi:hypothetical protein